MYNNSAFIIGRDKDFSDQKAAESKYDLIIEVGDSVFYGSFNIWTSVTKVKSVKTIGKMLGITIVIGDHSSEIKDNVECCDADIKVVSGWYDNEIEDRAKRKNNYGIQKDTKGFSVKGSTSFDKGHHRE